MSDVEQLVARLSLDMRQFRKEMLAAQGVSARQARAIESTWANTNRKLNSIGRNMASGLVAPLTGIAAAMSVREVLAYADAWTGAKNSLAVAGVVGKQQVKVLDELYASAQANAAPVSALADLFGKGAQAADNLGASQEELLKFSNGVAVSLRVAGKSAGESSGALTQLGQLLGQARVQAEEFNSVNEGARPILMAVAAGLDEAGGSVNKLKQLVNDGKVSGKQFFEAFLVGMPAVEKMAANATQTIQQGYTKVSNALTKYIGETDESLGASQRLVQGLNSLADNFENTADVTLKLAGIIAGALVGRSIAGMIVKLGLGAAAITRFVAALAAARTAAGVATAIGGMGAVAGPVGLVIGTVLTGALIAFGTSSDEASDAAKRYANALKQVEDAAKDAEPAVRGVASAAAEMQAAEEAFAFAKDEIKKVQRELSGAISLLDDWTMREYVTPQQIKQLKDLEAGLADGSVGAEQAREKLLELANESPDNKLLTDFLNPLIDGFERASKAAGILLDEVRVLGAEEIPLDPGIEGRRMQMEREKGERFLDQRSKDAAKTEVEKDIDTRTKAIVKAANDVGVAITEAAARIQAQSEIAIENSTKAASSAVDLVKKFEGYSDKAYYDVNAYRNGYGSDTMTGSDGSVSKVTAQSITTLADANRDLARRIGEFQDGIRGKIGASKFDSMSENQQAALTSIAYNYGSLPDRIAKAIQTGNEKTVYDAITGLGSDNKGVNKDRRAAEADIYLSGSSDVTKNNVDTAKDAAKDAATRQKNFAEALERQKQNVEALKAETALRKTLNPLVNDYGKAMSELEAAQYLLVAAQEEQTAAGKELVDVQQLLTGDLSKLTPAAREQAEAMRALAQQTGEAEAAAGKLVETQDKVKDSLRQSSEFGKNVLGGFIQDMKNGKSAAEALEGALGKVADRLLDMALNSLFDGPKAGSGGGILGGLFSALFPKREHGGPVTAGKPYIVGEKRPEVFVPTQSGRILPRVPDTPAGTAGGGMTYAPITNIEVGANAGVSKADVESIVQDNNKRQAQAFEKRQANSWRWS